MSTSATPGDIFAALFAAHHVGDYWAQTDTQACDKGLPGWRGRLACARHVASMTACKAGALGVLHVTGRRVSWRRAAVTLAADAASHYWADRRTTLAGFADLLGATVVPGKGDFCRLGACRPGRDDNPCGATGAALLDQAFHIGCLWLAAVAAGKAPRPA